MEFDARRVDGLKVALISGDGLVMEFTGPGVVWYQSRGLETFVEEVYELLLGTGQENDAGDVGLF